MPSGVTHRSIYISWLVPRMATAGWIGLVPVGVNQRGPICTVGWDGMSWDRMVVWRQAKPS